MLMCIIAPLIGLAVRKLPALVLPALALLFVFGIGNGWRGFSNSALLFFSLGGFSLLGGVDGALATLLRAGSSAFGAWCYMFIAPVAVAASAFLLFMLLRRLCPSVLAVLTGGRLSPRR